jgi:hypothetical protein
LVLVLRVLVLCLGRVCRLGASRFWCLRGSRDQASKLFTLLFLSSHVAVQRCRYYAQEKTQWWRSGYNVRGCANECVVGFWLLTTQAAIEKMGEVGSTLLAV